MFGVTALRDFTCNFIWSSISWSHAMATKLLFMIVTLVALLAAVDHTANGHLIADLVASDRRPHLNDLADNFMAGNQWILLWAPVSIDGMQV